MNEKQLKIFLKYQLVILTGLLNRSIYIDSVDEIIEKLDFEKDIKFKEILEEFRGIAFHLCSEWKKHAKLESQQKD